MSEAFDSSNNGNNGTYVGSYSLGEVPLTGEECGTCVKLTGGYINISNVASALTGSESITGILFAKLDLDLYADPDEMSAKVVTINNSDDSFYSLQLVYSNTTALPSSYVFLVDGVGVATADVSAVDVADVHCIYFNCDFTTGEMFLIVGSMEADADDLAFGTPITPPSLGSSMILGADSLSPTEDGATNFYGWLDDVAFFTRALSSDELTDILESCLPVVEPIDIPVIPDIPVIGEVL